MLQHNWIPFAHFHQSKLDLDKNLCVGFSTEDLKFKFCGELIKVLGFGSRLARNNCQLSAFLISCIEGYLFLKELLYVEISKSVCV